MKGGTFKLWPIWCSYCEKAFETLGWSYDLPLECPDCKAETLMNFDVPFDKAPGIVSDELHGYEARHGVCNPDGSPRKFYSKTDLKRALNEKGLVIAGDTPGKPYPVSWSGRQDGSKET